MKKTDIMIGIYLLAAIVCLFITLPPGLLDVMLAINITVAFIILFTALYSNDVLDMQAFPSMLLFTTIFRIALNVSSTKLILSTGNPGKVVKAFGSFVAGNDLVIGVIVFIILLIVQLIIINKGSERVAEVTARFTLDAMPGKQMAIDADLNTGAITDKEAKIRREKLQQEASFFGSMDGATKYVKGDATAGIIITVINFVGGIIMGMTRRGMDISTALSTYALLTVGDGLVSQIPSLLISLSSGIVVTKASKEVKLPELIIGELFYNSCCFKNRRYCNSCTWCCYTSSVVCICTVGSRSYSNVCCNDPETGSCRDRRRSRKCGYGSKRSPQTGKCCFTFTG